MNNTPWTIEDAENTYHVKRWSDGYFHINENGHVSASPEKDPNGMVIDLQHVVEAIKQTGLELPAVVRFHDILRTQVEQLNETFAEVIDEVGYNNRYMGVFPIKVNQMREVVEEILEAGEPYDYGLEAGSKAELLAALAYNSNPNALTIMNGFKDEEYLRLSFLGRKLGRKMVVVVEQFSELELLVRLAKEYEVRPIIGLRVKMMIKSLGKWKASSGERAKFGLSISEILKAVDYLKAHDMLECIELLHFHIGSQIADINVFNEAILEFSTVYCRLAEIGVHIKYADVGGGLAVDYDGSKSTNDSSRNYNLKEYARSIVVGFQQVCERYNVPHPTIVSESGRAITAHHSCIVAQVVDEINPADQHVDVTPQDAEHFFIKHLRDYKQRLEEGADVQSIYHSISQEIENTRSAFKLGMLTLEEMAKADTLFWQILEKLQRAIGSNPDSPFELDEVPERLSSLYLINMSIFQSIIDAWAIEQILPVVPIDRLDEKPTKLATLADITCDSDGKIDKFIGDEEIVNQLPVHDIKAGEDYCVAIFLTGAYQDVMGDMHNLFGRLNEVHVYGLQESESGFYIEETVKGTSKKRVLQTLQYSSEVMIQLVKTQMDSAIRHGVVKRQETSGLIDYYEDCLKGYTYLEV